MQELSRLRLLYWQPAEDEGTGSEPEVLAGFLSLQTNAGDRLGATKPLFRGGEFTVNFAKNRSGPPEAGTA